MCRIDEIQSYDLALPPNLAMLLDSMQRALDDTFHEELKLESPMRNDYIQSHFMEPMRARLGCKFFAFTNFTIYLTIIKARDDGCIDEKNDCSIPIGNSHEDNLNGQQEGNNLCLIFHLLIKLALDNERNKHYLGRFTVIAYTRRSLESHEKNEKLLINLKDGLTNFKNKVDEKYKQICRLYKLGGDPLSFSFHRICVSMTICTGMKSTLEANQYKNCSCIDTASDLCFRNFLLGWDISASTMFTTTQR